MKLIKNSILFFLIASSFYNSGCTRENPQVSDTDTNIGSLATIQIFNATANARRNSVSVDGVRVSSSVVAQGGIFPATAFAFTVSPGSRSLLIMDTLPATTQAPVTFSETYESGKSYTIFTYDTITSPKHITVTNDIVVPSDTTSRIRFANFIFSGDASPSIVDVYSLSKGFSTPIFKNIAINQVSDFITYPGSITDSFYVCAAGTISPILARGAATIVAQRYFTGVISGSTKAAKILSVFATY